MINRRSLLKSALGLLALPFVRMKAKPQGVDARKMLVQTHEVVYRRTCKEAGILVGQVTFTAGRMPIYSGDVVYFRDCKAYSVTPK